MFRYLLRLSDDEPNATPAYLRLIGNYEGGETFTFGEGQQLRIVVIDWDIPHELRDRGFHAIFFVEPV